jgi:RHS repeat-associated protein
LAVGVLVIAAACSSSRSQESVGSTAQAVTNPTMSRVLSFEQPTTDWSAANLKLQQGDQFVDGQHSAAVTVVSSGGKLTSIPLSSLGPISPTVTLQVRLPAYVASTTYQGQVALWLNSPTAGVFNQYFGPFQFSNAPTGVFRQAQFTLPAAIVAALSFSTYSDLTASVELDFNPNPNPNAGFSDPFYIDALDFGQGPSGGGGGGGTAGTSATGGTTGASGSGGNSVAGGGASGSATVGGAGTAGTAGAAGTGTTGPCPFSAQPSGGSSDVAFTIKLPKGVRREDVAIGTTGGHLTLDDGVSIVKDSGGFASISSVQASNRTNLGVGVAVQDLYTEATGVDLRTSAHVHGTLQTAADFTAQTGVVIDGESLQNTSLQPLESISWNVSFPNTNQGSCSLEPDNTEVVDPGSYGDIAVKSRSHLKVRSGTYYFNSLSFESQSELDIDNSAGPVFLYVRTNFAFSGSVVETNRTHMNFLFGVAGNGSIALQTAFRGVLVAPFASVSLPTDSSVGHVGAFFANSLIAHQNTAIHQRPLAPSEFCASDAACSSFCPCGDSGGICGVTSVNREPSAADPNCVDGACCADGTNLVSLASTADTYNNTTDSVCLLALGGNDTLSSAALGVTIVGGPGDDVITEGQFLPSGGGVPPTQIFGGPGNDTISGWFDGAQIFGGPGDDTISGGPGPVVVAPGSGVDHVSTGDGDDTFVLYSECEATPGKTLLANGGVNTLISPLSIDELRAHGLTVEGFEKVIIRSDACKSDCTAKPSCGPGTQCADRNGQAVCGNSTAGSCTTCSDCLPGLVCTNGECVQPACVPSCSNKRCGDDLSDGCGGSCAPVCNPGQVGCVTSLDCPAGTSCEGRTPGAPFPNVCVAPACMNNPRTLGCGFPGAACGPSCTVNPTCTSNSDCAAGYVCGANNGYRYGAPGENVCERPGCETEPKVLGCGTIASECGTCTCTPNCANKHCGDTDMSDGCGGTCAAVCVDGDPNGCVASSDCKPGSVCVIGGGARIGLASGLNACLPASCVGASVAPPDCGTATSKCGLCPTSSSSLCSGRECGSDPVSHEFCGNCPAGNECNASGQCISEAVPAPIVIADGNGGSRTISPPTITALPGFGATPGEFGVSERGSSTYAIPVSVPPGRAGIEPELAIRYASSTSNGALGVGWSVDGLSTITRCQRTYAQDGYTRRISTVSDDALCLDGQRLVSVGPNEYRTEVETFAKVIRFNLASDPAVPDYFKVFTKNGRILYFGSSPNAKGGITGGIPRTWALSRIEDRAGNFMRVSYRSGVALDWNSSLLLTQNLAAGLTVSTTELLPDSISYTGFGNADGDREVVFAYEDSRPDKLSGFQPGGGHLVRSKRLDHIEIRAAGNRVREYQLRYEIAPNNTSRIASIQECGSSDTICRAPTTFSYFDEQGFDAGTVFNPPFPPPGSGAPERFAPSGITLQTLHGYDRLAMVSASASFSVGTPLPGGADMALYAPALAVASPYLDAAILAFSLFNAASASTDVQPWVLSETYDFLNNSLSLGAPCGAQAVPAQQVVRGPFGEDSLFESCPATKHLIFTNKTPSGAHSTIINQDVDYMPRVWLTDVDGDGVQDKLYCAPDELNLDYKLAKGGQVPTDANHDQRDGQVLAPANLCRLQCATVGVPGSCPATLPTNVVFDVDGDGTGNLLVYDQSIGGWWSLAFGASGPNFALLTQDASERLVLDWSKYYLTAIDANGDGLRDILALPSSKRGMPVGASPWLWLNTGTSLQPTALEAGPGFGDAPILPAFVMDYDHDGVEDLVEPTYSSASSQVSRPWFVRHFRDGKVTSENIPFPGPGFPGVVGDFDGDGNLDIMTREIGPGGRYLMHRGSGRRQNLLKAVTDGLGRRVEVQYDRTTPDAKPVYTQAGFGGTIDDNGSDCAWPSRCLSKLDQAVVSSYSEQHYSDQQRTLLQTDRQFSYTYHAAIADAGGLGWLGFESRSVLATDNTGAFLKRTDISYLPIVGSKVSAPIAPPYTLPLAGQVRDVEETFAHADSTLQRPGLNNGNHQVVFTHFDWQVQSSSANRPFAALLKKTTTVNEAESGTLDGGGLFGRVEDYVTDQYGNLADHTVTEFDYAGPAAGEFGTTVPGSTSVFHAHKTFSPTTNELENWLINLPKEVDVDDQPRCIGISVTCPGEKKSRHSDFSYYSNGLLLSSVREQGDPNLELSTVFVRDALGNVEAVIATDHDGDSRLGIIGYDDRRLFPTSFTNGKNQATQVRMDERFGQLAARVDANGIDETWSYDDFGVLRFEHGPEGDREIDYGGSDLHGGEFGISIPAVYHVTTSQAGGDATDVEFNALGQVVQRKSSGLNGATILEQFAYDDRNRLEGRTRPHIPGDPSQSFVNYDYDNLDRVVTENYPDGAVVRYEYAFLTSVVDDVASFFGSTQGAISITRVTDPNGHATMRATDRKGRVVKAVDALGHNSEYSYGAFGVPELFFMPDGNAMRYGYDSYNRIVLVNDAALGGRSTADYNGFDEIVSSTDPASRESRMFYDVLGRIDHVEDADGTTQWIYDGTGPNEIGRLIETISPTGQHTHYGYEPPTTGRNRGLLEQVTEDLLAPVSSSSSAPRELTTQYHYDNFSRLTQVDYPGIASTPFGVKYDFDNNGHTIKASDAAQPSTVYWQLLAGDQGYRVGTEQLGNGAVTQRTYEPLTGRVSTIHTTSGGQILQDLAYSYDLGGNLTERQQNRGAPPHEEFRYDALDRLVSNFNEFASEGGYSYDSRAGRLQHQDGVGDYTYFTQGRDWVKTAGENEYTHDALGNIITRSGPSIPGGSQEIDYTTFNLPSHITTGTGASAASADFAYSADGARVVKQTATSSVFYAGDLYQATTRGADTNHRYMVYAGGRAVAAVTQDEIGGTASSRTVQFLHDDALGSIEDTTSSDGSLVSHRGFGNFGNPAADLTGTSSPPYGYTGQEHDAELGLINMHGRMYDPVLGQFLSPDPVMQAPFSQGFNRFAYAFNSPHNYVDPSGFDADPTTVGIDVGIAAGYGAGLYFTLAGGGSASVGASVAAGGGAAAFSSAGVSAAAVVSASAGAATGVGLLINAAVLNGVHPPSVAPQTVHASSRSAVVTSAHSPTLGRTHTAVGTAPVTEKLPVPKAPSHDSEWGPTPDVSHTPGAYEAPSVPNKILSNKEFKVEDTSETWKHLFEAATIFVPGAGEEEGAVIALPKVVKAVNSKLAHAAERAAEHGISSSVEEAAEALRALSNEITKSGLPPGTILDSAHTDRVLVPFGKRGYAVYQIAKNATAKLKTVLIAR